MGRNSKLTPERQAKIVDLIRAGNYAQVAARCAGIDEATFYRWLEKGEHDEEGPYRDFRNAVKAAEAEAEASAVAMVLAAAPDCWQAAMTYLERRFADRWKRRDRIEAAVAPTEPLKVLSGVDESKL